MEESKEHIRNILKQASQPAAPSDMAERVLSTWKKEQRELKVAPPLISSKAWIVIGLGLVGIAYWIIKSSTGTMPQTLWGDLVHRVDTSFSFEAIQLHPVMFLSMLALAIMIGVNVLVMNEKWRMGNLSLF